MNKILGSIVLLMVFMMTSAFSQEEATKAAPQNQAQAVQAQSEEVYAIQVRVIFGGTTGIKGTVPHKLIDMRTELINSYDYASFELSNTIRLSVFDGEEATALVFPDHYLKLSAIGTVKSGIKIKADVFEVSSQLQSERNRVKGDRDLLSVKEKDKGAVQESLFPVVSSALLLTKDRWEAVGGIPVRVNSKGMVNGNRLSTSSANRVELGQQKYLILGMKLEK